MALLFLDTALGQIVDSDAIGLRQICFERMREKQSRAFENNCRLV
jgi:hypothetical protein